MVIETRTVADHSSAPVSTSLLLMPSPVTSRTEKSTWDPTALTVPGIAGAHRGEEQGVVVGGLDKLWQTLHNILDPGPQQAANFSSQRVRSADGCFCAPQQGAAHYIPHCLLQVVWRGSGSVCPDTSLESTVSSSSA